MTVELATPSIPTDLEDSILTWYAAVARPLAFRRTTDPYAVLVSEAMAQQTQAARAATYWERFITRFPTVEALAAASPADVLREWQGLGYDRRALNLWRAAGVIVADHGGQVPSDIEALQALPGVGPYTARAVAALAFGRPVGAVDTNVRRVLGRIVAGDPAALTTADMQRLADGAVPADHPGTWTHALMDLGATICKPRRPACDACPAKSWCRFAREGAPVATHAARQRAAPFTSTTRWLRGRLMDRLRAVPAGDWATIDGAMGTHDEPAVHRALVALERDGLIETRMEVDHPQQARLRMS